jgi:hypothetical protein
LAALTEQVKQKLPVGERFGCGSYPCAPAAPVMNRGAGEVFPGAVLDERLMALRGVACIRRQGGPQQPPAPTTAAGRTSRTAIR